MFGVSSKRVDITLLMRQVASAAIKPFAPI
jgi:hypothetical protein